MLLKTTESIRLCKCTAPEDRQDHLAFTPVVVKHFPLPQITYHIVVQFNVRVSSQGSIVSCPFAIGFYINVFTLQIV